MSQTPPPALGALLDQFLPTLEAYLDGLYRDWDVPPLLAEACRYSLLAGGKRFRPVLCLAAALACLENAGSAAREADLQAVLPFAASLELIHTYSLIHDDLPAMDDDDLRRGKPTSHVIFGEGQALLAGDALLSDAFALAASCPLPAQRLIRALALLAEEAGSQGMVGGQSLDLQAEQQSLNLEQLIDLQSRKTGALIRAACQCGAILTGADPAVEQALAIYGQCLGLIFQITDDILDVVGDEKTVGKRVRKDAQRAKATWPGLVGLEQARNQASQQAAQAAQALTGAGLTGPRADFLIQLAQALLSRVY